jgi:hypothetical protein
MARKTAIHSCMPTASSLMMDFDITLKFDFMYARFLDVVDICHQTL